MLTEIAEVLRRSRDTFLQDLIGAASLAVMLVAALYIPAF
ncbi:hypothetical protein SAMN05421751_101548 [Jhaorihella thermophila]|uniref:Uncharacterized protein n=1 Tax=Jhaorihella thermophila TaxID=488547 RepID=A0A1H5SIU2_9RHOB|nr:hypothetical protein SAMN05421751_101548 [Jhaorihella thermophila]